MSDQQVGFRYAQALYEVISPEEQTQVAHDLWQISQIMSDSEIARVFSNPKTPQEFKKQLFLSMQPTPILERFLLLLLEKSRENHLNEISTAFRDLVNQAAGRTIAEVTSAVPLAADTISAIQEKLEKLTGKTVEVTTRLDDKLWGGMVIKIDGKVIDSSLYQSLERLKHRLLITQ